MHSSIEFLWILFLIIVFMIPCLVRIRALQNEINVLKLQMSKLIEYMRKQGADIPEAEKTGHKVAQPVIPLSPVYQQEPKESLKKKVSDPERKKQLMQKFFEVLPVWIGGVALALAGAFMVKYSIETGLLSPSVRLTLGGLFGVLLLGLGHWIHDREGLANGRRISQALSGAGIADLYVCLFAAASFYHLIPPSFGFVGMGVVTAIAVVLSLKQGPPIALLGMVGGFLTPALFESQEPNALWLFLYLYFLVAGLFTVIRQKNWWFIAIPVVLATFAWTIFWLETRFAPDEGSVLALFLLAVVITIVFHSHKAVEQPGTFKFFPALNYLSLGGAVFLMSIVAVKSHFGMVEWELFGCLALGGMIMAFYNPKVYGFVPWVSGVMAVILLWNWPETDSTTLGATLLGFALLYAAGSYWLMWRSPQPVSWGLLSTLSGLTFYILAYSTWGSPVRFSGWHTYNNFWGFFALGLFVLSIGELIRVLNSFQGEAKTKQRLLTIFTLTATAFLSIGVMMEIDAEFLTIILAAEILAISWINGYVDIKTLRPLTGAFAVVFVIFLISQPFNQVWLWALFSALVESKLFGTLPRPHLSPYQYVHIPSTTWSLVHLGVPAMMFSVSSVLLRRQKDDGLVRAFELISIGLIAIMTAYLVRHVFHIHEEILLREPTTFIERATLTNIFFLYGLGCLWFGDRFNRKAIIWGGGILLILALARILLLDLLFANPVFSSQYVGSLPVLNGLLLAFGLPILWLVLAKQLVTIPGKQKYVNTCLFILLFAFVSFNVRQVYHGAYLDQDIMSNGELYTYSAVWLLTGLALLFFGALKKNKALQMASLIFIALATTKIFVYDAAGLTGLLRIFSFLGLGISLLGMSWFYARFVKSQEN